MNFKNKILDKVIARIFIFFLFSVITSIPVYSQDIDSIFWSEVLKAHDDSVAIVFLEPVEVYDKLPADKKLLRKYRRSTRRYNRTIKNVKKVYPYAKKASVIIKEVDYKLPSFYTKKEKKKYLSQEYKKLMCLYKKPIMNLRISQGRILMLLIDRETGNTSYEHIKELKGGAPAIFWQAMARMFGHNLKSEYEPHGKHRMIENIVLRIERGEI